MPLEDAFRWNKRYVHEKFDNFRLPRPFLVENIDQIPGPGNTLDLAMGLGGNAGFLLERGYTVTGVDISGVAVRQAKQDHPRLDAVIADLSESLPFSADSFDVILTFYYLERSLWPQYRRVLRRGGILVLETLTLDMNQERQDIDPRYLLQPGELRAAFSDWQILAYREGWEETHDGYKKATASLVARLV